MAEFRFDQATPGTGNAGEARHDLVSGEVITLVATNTGAGISHTWEIIDKVGSTATLSAMTGDSVTIGAAVAITAGCSFLIEHTENDNGIITTSRRPCSVRTTNAALRFPLFAETSPVSHTLSANDPDNSTDNASYINRAGLGVTEKNWRGWSEWTYEVTLAIETLAGSGGGPPSGAAGGDLGGTYPNPSVDGLQGVTVSPTSPSSGEVLTYNGSEWAPAASAGGPPSGAAGGDLGGTYPNPSVDGLQGVGVSAASPSSGEVLTYNGSVWAPAAPSAVSDLQGAYDGGASVTITGATPVSLDAGTETSDLLTLTRTNTGAGDAVSISMGAAATGSGITLALTNGSHAPGIDITHVSGQDAVSITDGSDTLLLRGDVVLGAMGSAGAPTYSFGAAPTYGVYMPTAGSVGIATGGNERLRVAANQVALVAAGSAALPSLDLGIGALTGLYLSSAGRVGITTDGVAALTIEGQLTAGTGDETSLNFTPTINKATSGNYIGFRLDVTETSAPGADNRLLDLQVGSITQYYITNQGRVRADAGAASSPGFAFNGTPTTGFYLSGGFRIAVSGVGYYQFGTGSFIPLIDDNNDLGAVSFAWRTGYFGTSVICGADGTASAPAITVGGTSQGLYRPAASQVGLAAGTESVIFDADSTTAAFRPDTDNNISSGEASLRWTTVYSVTLDTGDIDMRGQHDDAHWTLNEDRQGIYAHDRRTGKKYRLVLEEVDEAPEPLK